MAQTTHPAVYQTELEGIELKSRGKVRDIYDLGDALLLVASDRISAFDCVLPDSLPGKGRVLNQISEFWFDLFADRIPNHVIATDVADFPAQLHPFASQLEGRTTLAKKLDMMPVECVARGYLSGSGWKDYQRSGAVCGIELPAGLRESDKLPEPIFTPSTKAQEGHDENISFEEVVKLIGKERATELKERTLELYLAGADYARGRGIIIADTKFEFGLDAAGTLIIADEVLTPDSSRFWPADRYEPGRGQSSFDKQFVRDYLETLDWDKQAPAPKLPQEIIDGALERYHEIFHKLTDRTVR